ncbi:MAG TPA: hypothetical protein VMT81_01170 [Candidatus Paceibacterota bacterium]|nr:hypothetical protein [Candidatus Paceibacterota bacterium]
MKTTFLLFAACLAACAQTPTPVHIDDCTDSPWSGKKDAANAVTDAKQYASAAFRKAFSGEIAWHPCRTSPRYPGGLVLYIWGKQAWRGISRERRRHFGKMVVFTLGDEIIVRGDLVRRLARSAKCPLGSVIGAGVFSIVGLRLSGKQRQVWEDPVDLAFVKQGMLQVTNQDVVLVQRALGIRR